MCVLILKESSMYITFFFACLQRKDLLHGRQVLAPLATSPSGAVLLEMNPFISHLGKRSFYLGHCHFNGLALVC